MKYQYSFHSRLRDDLCRYLNQHDIAYETLGDPNDRSALMFFSVWSTRKDCDCILKDIYTLTLEKPWIYAHYSDKDLSSAELLTMRPKSTKMCIENIDESFRYSCRWSYLADRFEMHKANHKEQIGPIMIKKEPSASTRTAFWGPDDGGTIIFADKKVERLIHKEKLEGIFFKDVLLKNRTPSNRVIQMLAEHTVHHSDIVWGRGEKVIVCEMCGKKQYSLPDAYELHLYDSSIYREKDFFSTERIWGDGIAQPIYIVSQKFYQLLKGNKLTAQVEFTPVTLE